MASNSLKATLPSLQSTKVPWEPILVTKVKFFFRASCGMIGSTCLYSTAFGSIVLLHGTTSNLIATVLICTYSTANGALQAKLRNIHTYQLFIRSVQPLQKAFQFPEEGFRFFEVTFDSP